MKIGSGQPLHVRGAQERAVYAGKYLLTLEALLLGVEADAIRDAVQQAFYLQHFSIIYVFFDAGGAGGWFSLVVLSRNNTGWC